MLENDIIVESQSPWSFPAILLEKRRHPGENVQYRLCIDYRELNKITKTDFFPLPHLQDTIDQLSGAKLFSTMDLSSGYYQVELDERDREKSAFSTPDNHYEFKRMAMGLKNSPATWQRLMGTIFSGYTGTECLVYLDDIIVFSKNDLDEHLLRLRHIFDRLRASNLKLKPTKCHFLKSQTKYLGHLISADGVQTDEEKTQIIKRYPVPRTVKEIRAFLGLCGFYRKFVYKFAEISQPLTALTKKSVKFVWTEKQQQAFEKLKQALITPPILKYPDFNRSFILCTDASGSAISGILCQEYDNVEHPVCYSSRSLNEAERRYSTTEREMLAVYFFIHKYKIYLTGKHFTVYTDHRPLRYLLTFKGDNCRLSKWALNLQEYSFTMEYRPGRLNSNVDGLTRLREQEEKPTDKIQQIAVIHEVPFEPMTTVVWSTEEMKKLQREDAELSQIINQVTPNDERYYISPFGILFLKRTADERNDKVMAPRSIVNDILKIYHNASSAGHMGQKKTLQLIQRDFFWRGMRTDVQNYCERCHSCNLHKTNYQPPATLQKIPVPSCVFGRISLDIVGPLHRTRNGNKYILTCIDYLTRYPEAIPLPDIKAETVAKAFVTNVITRFGTPFELLTDCGTQFVGKLFTEMCKILEIKKLNTTPYRPQANGAIERLHRTLKTTLSHYIDETNDSWDEQLPFVLQAYRNHIHESTKESPFFLMFGRDQVLPHHLTLRPTRIPYDIDTNYVSEFVLRMKQAHETVKYNLENAAEQQCTRFNRKAKPVKFNVGDRVYLYTPLNKTHTQLARKFYPKWSGPYRIIDKLSDVTFKIQGVSTRKIQIVHANRLKLCKGPLPTEDIPDDQLTESGNDEPENDQENDVEIADLPPVRRNENYYRPAQRSEDDESSDTSSERKVKDEDEEFWDSLEENISTEKQEPDSESTSEENSRDLLSRLAEYGDEENLLDESEPEDPLNESVNDPQPSTAQLHPYQTRSQGPVEDLPWVLPKHI